MKSFRKKGSRSTSTSIIPVQVQQEIRANRVNNNSTSKWYHQLQKAVLMIIIIILVICLSYGIIVSPLVPVFYLFHQLDLFARVGQTYRKMAPMRFFAVCSGVFWATFLWSAYDAGFLNLILETLWANKHVAQFQLHYSIVVVMHLGNQTNINTILNFFRRPSMNNKEILERIESFWYEFAVFVFVRNGTQHFKLYDTFKNDSAIMEGLKWTSIASFLLIVYKFITFFTDIMVYFLKYCEYGLQQCPKRMIECFLFVFWEIDILFWVNGLKDSIGYVLGSLWLLFAWERFCLPLFHQPERVKDFGYWTCVSLLICSILWLIKTYGILLWEAHAITKYKERLGSDILNESNKQLYFLISFVEDRSGPEFTYVLRQKLQETYRYYLLNVDNKTFTMYTKHQMVKRYYLGYKDIFRKRNVISIFIDQLKRSICNIEAPACEKDETKKINSYLTRIISKDDLICFDERLEKDGFGNTNHQNITLQGLQNWMEKARTNYLHIVDTMSRQQAIADCVDKIMTIVVLLASIVIWLHLTGLSTTNVIVAIVSSLVFGNFMFRDIWKTMMTGITFVYFMHPFEVGDLCIVNDEKMEVKSVDIWRTTFENVETQEEVIYSNSDLSNKKIINHKTYFDWNDYKELNVGSLEAVKVIDLKNKILEYFSDETKFTKSSVEVLTTGDDIKIAAKFRYNPTNLENNNSYYECLNKKCLLRSEFVLHVQKLLDEHKDPPNVKTADEFLYKEHVPAIVMEYLDKWINVKGDGNCGFRCVSHAYQGDQEQWSFIRNELVTEIKGHPETYKSIYGHLQDGSSEKDEMVNSAINRIDKPDQGPAIRDKWMDMDDLYAVATRFNYAVIFFVKHETETDDKKEGLIGCCTILPLRAEVGVTKPEAELAIVHVQNNHYIRLMMKDDHPLPPIDNRWFLYKDNSVKDWDTIHYADRLKRWNKEASI